MLEREDYLEPNCVLCGQPGEETPFRPIPQDRVQEKLREYEDRNDWPGVERHLKYWMAEALDNQDERGQLMLHNEMMGFYRKQGLRDEAIAHAEAALNLIRKLGMDNTVTAGTTWVNAGTVREAFGDPAGGIACFEKARENYEKNLPSEDGRLGGLYNNMGLAMIGCKRYEAAEDLFHRALAVMEKQENGELEQAITWLNLADTAEAAQNPEEAEIRTEACLERAEKLLDSEQLPRNGYYAFVCEKCAPVFGHYGWFMTEAELLSRAQKIHQERTR